jgi:hypothetical protein
VIIESIAGAAAALSSINQLISAVNEGKANVSSVMGMISDFGEGLNNFEVERRKSTFKPLSQNDLLKLSQLRRQQERYWKDVHDLLAMLDPQLLDDFKAAKRQQEEARQAHLKMVARKKKEREHLYAQIAVGVTTILVGGIIITLGFMVLFRVYG